jgi:hypothetical protein
MHLLRSRYAQKPSPEQIQHTTIRNIIISALVGCIALIWLAVAGIAIVAPNSLIASSKLANLSLNQNSLNENLAHRCYREGNMLSSRSVTDVGVDHHGVMQIALQYCRKQNNIYVFGQITYMEDGQRDPGFCYIREDSATPGGFQKGCADGIRDTGGPIYTPPAITDGRHSWQACWVDESVKTPHPACTDLTKV